jgi:purine-binding chemotaxis protein CheW
MGNARAIDYQNDYALGDEQFLTFSLSGEEYGIPILKVQEIRSWDRVTPIPNSPAYIRGVLNLRGLIVPVMDLRLRFHLKEIEYTALTAIIVINVGGRMAGLAVDSVSDVIGVNADQHCAAPEYEGQKEREFIMGLAQSEGKLLILLDVERLVGLEVLENAANSGASGQ